MDKVTRKTQDHRILFECSEIQELTRTLERWLAANTNAHKKVDFGEEKKKSSQVAVLNIIYSSSPCFDVCKRRSFRFRQASGLIKVSCQRPRILYFVKRVFCKSCAWQWFAGFLVFLVTLRASDIRRRLRRTVRALHNCVTPVHGEMSLERDPAPGRFLSSFFRVALFVARVL